MGEGARISTWSNPLYFLPGSSRDQSLYEKLVSWSGETVRGERLPKTPFEKGGAKWREIEFREGVTVGSSVINVT